MVWGRVALAAREVAAAMARGTTRHLHVLSVYDYHFKAPASGLPAEMLAHPAHGQHAPCQVGLVSPEKQDCTGSRKGEGLCAGARVGALDGA